MPQAFWMLKSEQIFRSALLDRLRKSRVERKFAIPERSRSMENNTDSYDPKKKSFRDDEPPFTGIRKWMRDQLLQHVKGGIHTVAAIQKTQTPFKTKFFHIASITGNHNFYLTFFPLMYFAAGYQDLTRRLAVLMGLGIYLGNWFKDYLCLPRPGPPAVHLSHSGHGEFGFPSTHSVAALNIPFYALLTLMPFNSIYFIPAFLFACFYTFVVSYSRVYLGMHCVTDILGGFAVAAALLFPWYYLSWDAAFDYWLFHGGYVPLILVTAGASIMFLHPEPYSYCPCFEDSACFVGVVVGLLTGWSRFQPLPFQNWTVYAITLRYVLGVGALFGVRFVMKPLMIRILPSIIETFHLPTRRFLKHLKPSDASEVRIKSIPSIVDIRESKNTKTSVKYDIDIATKFIVYTLMGWAATELAPRTFVFLNIV